MALQKDIKHKGVNLTYHKIIRIINFDMTTERIGFELASYFSKTQRNQNANNYIDNPIRYNLKMDEIDIKKDILGELYKWIKERNTQFNESKDV